MVPYTGAQGKLTSHPGDDYLFPKWFFISPSALARLVANLDCARTLSTRVMTFPQLHNSNSRHSPDRNYLSPAGNHKLDPPPPLGTTPHAYINQNNSPSVLRTQNTGLLGTHRSQFSVPDLLARADIKSHGDGRIQARRQELHSKWSET